MSAGDRDGRRRGAPSAARFLVPVGMALLVGGLVQLVKVVEAGRSSSPAGAVLALLVGAGLIAYGWRRRYSRERSAAKSSSAGVAGTSTTAHEDVATEQDVLEQVRVEVLPGFTPRDEVAERVSEYFEGYAGPTGPDDVAPMVDAVWSQRLAEESSWTGTGDYARVRAAFEELEGRGFVARMNFACCQTCGHAEIDDERRGGEHSYVFFHAQDTELLAEDDTALHLAFGCFDTHPMLEPDPGDDVRASGDDGRARVAGAWVAAETEAGAQITESLRRQGLVVTWDRTPTNRPAVRISTWRKPLP